MVDSVIVLMVLLFVSFETLTVVDCVGHKTTESRIVDHL